LGDVVGRMKEVTLSFSTGMPEKESVTYFFQGGSEDPPYFAIISIVRSTG